MNTRKEIEKNYKRKIIWKILISKITGIMYLQISTMMIFSMKYIMARDLN